MATTKVIPEVIDLNQASSTTGLRMPKGSSAYAAPPTVAEGMMRNQDGQTSNGSASCMQHFNDTEWKNYDNKSLGTTCDCNYPTTSNGISTLELDSNLSNACAAAPTATWSGTPAYSTSIKKYGTASAGLLTGGGAGNYINSNVDLDSYASWSFSFWMYRANSTDFHYAAGTLNSSVGACGGLIIGFESTSSGGKIDLVWRNSSCSTTFRSQGGTTALNTWTNIIITHDSSGSGSTAYYKNGTLVTPAATYSNPFAGKEPGDFLCFGSAGQYASERLEGYVDQTRIYDSVLTQSEIDDIQIEVAC